jgi:hypothetical protein
MAAGGLPAAGVPLAGMVAFRAADLQVRGGAGPGGAPGAAVVAGAAERVVPGELMTFCHPVVTAPAVVRGGAVVADAWLPDLVRLGELERHIGDGVIEAIIGRAVAEGRMRPHQRRRLMSLPFTVRLVVAMTLMPDASYPEAVRRLAGHLADVAWVRGMARPGLGEPYGLAGAGAAVGDGGVVLGGGRAAGR